MSAQPTRRALIGAAGLAAAAMTISAVARAQRQAGSDIEQQWQDRCRAYREFDADPAALEDNERANDYWDRVDAAEAAILNSPDVSVRAAELRLWVAWSHCDVTNREEVAQGDVPALRRIYGRLDWHEKLLFAAILNLRGEDAA